MPFCFKYSFKNNNLEYFLCLQSWSHSLTIVYILYSIQLKIIFTVLIWSHSLKNTFSWLYSSTVEYILFHVKPMQLKCLSFFFFSSWTDRCYNGSHFKIVSVWQQLPPSCWNSVTVLCLYMSNLVSWLSRSTLHGSNMSNLVSWIS